MATSNLHVVEDFQTPKKIIYANLKPTNICFICGEEKDRQIMRLLNNVALRETYLQLVKKALHIEMPPDCGYRLCKKCIVFMEKICSLRQSAIERLNALSSTKRSLLSIDTPSPANRKKMNLSEQENYPLNPPCQLKQHICNSSKSTCPPSCSLTKQSSSFDHSYDIHTSKTQQEFNETEQTRCEWEKKILLEMNNQMQSLCINDDQYGSILRIQSNDLRLTKVAQLAEKECKEKVPFLYKVLQIASGCNEKIDSNEKKGSDDNFFVFVIYGILMRCRSQRFNVLQRLVTSACLRYRAGNELLALLYRMRLSLSDNYKLQFLDKLADNENERLVSLLTMSKGFKLTIDNIDWYRVANQVRMSSGNRDYHYAHWTILPDRFTEEDLLNISDVSSASTLLEPKIFYCNTEENDNLRSTYAKIIARILVDEIPSLDLFKGCLQTTYTHRWSEIMNRKSEIFPQSIILESTTNLPSCVRILNQISERISKICSKAGIGQTFRDGDLKVTIGGDQLIRVNFESAKLLRAGTRTADERFEQFSPVVIEFFHVQQDLLEKIFKKFYLPETSRFAATLTNFKAELRRSNVTGSVKANSAYEAHKDFALTVTRMLIVELFLELNKLENIQDVIPLPQHIKSWSSKKKLEWLLSAVQPVTDAIFVSYCAPREKNIFMKVRSIDGTDYVVEVPVEMVGKTYECVIDNVKLNFQIPGSDESIQESSDDLYKYNISFVRSMMDFMVLQDCVSYGDIDMLTIILKRLIPLFVGLHSFRSKYLIELINFLTKTEHILSPKLSTCVKLRAFVNPSGRNGHNKPADLQQENNIKAVKNVVKGLGAGQTDKALVRASEAAPSINEINEKFKQSLGLNTGTFSERHCKDDTEDKSACLNILRTVRPFHIVQNRTCGLLKPFSESIIHSVNKVDLNASITRNAARVVGKAYVDIDDDDELNEVEC